MARLPNVVTDDLEPVLQRVASTGSNLFRVLLHSPGASKSISNIGFHLRRDSHLDPRLRELAILQVAWSTGTAYAWAHHVELSLHQGWLAPNDIHAIRSSAYDCETSYLLPTDCAVLRAARELTVGYTMSEDCFEQLGDELPEEELVDLLVVIAFYNLMARLLQGLNIELEDGYDAFLSQFPLEEPDPPLERPQ